MIHHMTTLVAEFSTAFKVRQYEMLSFVPGDVLDFRAKLILEEETEYANEMDVAEPNHSLVLDAICDLLYVSIGAAWVTNTKLADLHLRVFPVSNDITDNVSDVIEELQAPIPCQKRLPMFLNALHDQLLGIAAKRGYDLAAAFAEVHRTNMAKLWQVEDEQNKPMNWVSEKAPGKMGHWIVKDPSGKVRKPPGWVGPDLSPFTGPSKP